MYSFHIFPRLFNQINIKQLTINYLESVTVHSLHVCNWMSPYISQAKYRSNNQEIFLWHPLQGMDEGIWQHKI